jgi:hypothetical protein
MKKLKIKSLLVCLFGGILITACDFDFGEKVEDPFENIENQKIEILSGELFPFSASIQTTATHRLEKNGKLQAYLVSRVFNLTDFEGRKIEVEGFFKEEKMRPVFWVQSLKLLDAKVEIEEKTETRFATKKFTFLYPVTWNYTTAPNGTVYFTKKDDISRRVFLTFSIDDLLEDDKKLDFNVLIANLNGIKKLETLKNSQEKETLTLFSDTSNKKYTFIFTNSFDDFETKKAYFKLLQSFKEGELIVKQELEKERAIEAQKELEVLQKEQAIESLTKKAEEAEKKAAELKKEKKSESIFSRFLNKNREEDVIDNEITNDSLITGDLTDINKHRDFKNSKDDYDEIDEVIVKTSQNLENLSRDLNVGKFKNLINDKAYTYTSKAQGFTVKIPYGLWFVNYGKNVGLGMARHEVNDRSDATIWLLQVDKNFELKEVLEDDKLVIYKDKFKISGLPSDRNVMYSVLFSIKQ